MERMELRGLYRYGTHTPLKQLRRAARLVARLYGVPRCSVFVRRLHGYRAVYWWPPRKPSIQISPGFVNLATVAHELAHHVVLHRYRRAQDHGPRFVRVYAEILEILRLVPLAGMKAICKKHGVKMARPAV